MLWGADITYLRQLVEALAGRHSHDVRVAFRNINFLNVAGILLKHFRAEAADADSALSSDPWRLLDHRQVGLDWDLGLKQLKLLLLLSGHVHVLPVGVVRGLLISPGWGFVFVILDILN